MNRRINKNYKPLKYKVRIDGKTKTISKVLFDAFTAIEEHTIYGAVASVNAFQSAITIIAPMANVDTEKNNAILILEDLLSRLNVDAPLNTFFEITEIACKTKLDTTIGLIGTFIIPFTQIHIVANLEEFANLSKAR